MLRETIKERLRRLCDQPRSVTDYKESIEMQGSKTYECAGLAIAEPEGWVACYRAGHSCLPKEQIRTEREGIVSFSHRCPCCGSGGMTFGIPADQEAEFNSFRALETARSWDVMPPLDEIP